MKKTKQKQNKFKIIFAILTIAIFAFAQGIYADVVVSPDKIDKEIVFDKPKSAKNLYEETGGLTFKNTGNTSSSFTIPTWSAGAGWDAKIKVNASCPQSTALAPGDTARCTIKFKVSNDISPGGYKEYEKRYIGTYGGVPVTLTLKWLPPELLVSSDATFGKLKAGETKTGDVTIMETMGYKAAHAINFEIQNKEINASGVIASMPKSYLPELAAGASEKLQLKVQAPEKGLTPGEYRGTIGIKYQEDSLPGAPSLPFLVFNFEIANPKLGAEGMEGENKNQIIFSDFDIPYSGSREFTIKELDGFTPIEGINFSIAKAYKIYQEEKTSQPLAASWVTFDTLDFVPAGGSKKVKVNVNIPESAGIGEYFWEGKITTKYAGSLDIYIAGSVIFVELPKKKQEFVDMASLPVTKKSEDAENLRKNVLTLIEKSGGLYGLTEVITLSGASKTLLVTINNVNSFYEKNEIDKAYDNLIVSRTEVDTMDLVSPTQPDQKDTIDAIQNSANLLWKSYALDIAEKLEAEAEENQLTTPEICRDNYYKISVLYTKMRDTQNSLLYSEKSTECFTIITDSEKKAKDAEQDADELYEEANTKIFTVSDYKVVKLIFDYPEISKKYNESIVKYEEALNLWSIVNKQKGITRVTENIEKLNNEREMLKRTAIIYAAIIVWIIILLFVRFTLASANYNRDDLEANLSLCVSKEEVK